MSTTQQDKPAAKQRQRSRKASQKREQSPREALERLNQETVEQAAASTAMLAQDLPVQDLPVQDVPAVELPADAALANDKIEPEAEPTIKVEPNLEARVERPAVPLTGEVLPPVQSIGKNVSGAIGALAVAESWSNYARESFRVRKAFLDRLVMVRSFEEAIEAHGEFARLSYANFLAESSKLCELYGEWTRQLLRPFENVTAAWTRSAG